MPARSARAAIGPARAARLAAAASALVLAGTAAAGCSVVNKINHIRHSVDANRATIKTFTADLKDAKAKPFEVTYVTTGSAPATITYAVRPPSDLAFTEAAGSQGGSTRLVANSAGEYSCSQASPSSGWTCQKLAKASASAQNDLFSIYTPSHWAAFLDAVSIGAGLAGDKVATSSKVVNGFSLRCVDLSVKREGTSSICTTSQGILGYVKVAAQTTSFQIKSYTAAPPATAFQLPPGAKVTH
ncbi:MAG: hypothetical protein ACR2FU_21595 [Streptosporangiaceae bacterium]